MKLYKKISITLPAIIMLLYACESNFKQVQRINTVAFSPAGVSENINLKYTDSGKVKAIMVSPLMMDYSNLEFGFNEFPRGVHVTLLENNKKNTIVESDYAITYAKTDIIDLQGNVKITAAEGQVLTTQQLFYDQKNEWFYTEKDFKFTDNDGSMYQGPGLDFSKDFKIINMQRNKGEIKNVEDK